MKTDELLRRERWKLLVRINRLFNVPMNILAFIWLILTVIELTKGLPHLLINIVTFIWIFFWIQFIIELFLAPAKITYLKHHWLTALSLILPALRVFRIFRLVKYVSYVRGTHVIRILSSINRGMNALNKSLGKRGFSYVFSLTMIIIFAGAAGIMFFERSNTSYFNNYGTALWWTSMMITTMGSDYFPKSTEGRFLALLLAIYGFTIFGYVTATVATFFIDKDKMWTNSENRDLKNLQREIKEIKELVRERDQN